MGWIYLHGEQMERTILHLDMDAFFAAVEQRDRPELKGQPVIVGGLSDRGVVSTASYEARTYGVHSAMPMFTARQLCPQAVFLSGNRRRYSHISRQIMHMLHAFSPVLEKASIDEAYMDLSGCERLLGPIPAVAADLKKRILSEHGLTCSIGVAPNKFLAKIASDLDKPDGLTVIRPEKVAAFMASLPVHKLPGVGAKTVEQLKGLGIRTCAEVCSCSQQFWEARWGTRGRALYHLAQGRDQAPVVAQRRPKSCGAEDTFDQDTAQREVIKIWLLKQSDEVGQALRRIPSKGRTITLKIKFNDFQTLTRNITLRRPTSCTQTIYEAACSLLDQLPLPRSVRLCGVSVSHFHSTPTQLSLLPDPELTSQNLDRAVDTITSKYGSKALVRASVLQLQTPKDPR